jgi:hypothetical protein
MDSSIIAALVTASRRATKLGHRLRVQVTADWEVKLQIAGLADQLKIGLTREDVLRSRAADELH